MALELVTGYAGRPHVTAAQAGRFNAGIVGERDAVLPVGDRWRCTPASANSITVSPGDAVVNGRHVSMDIPQTLTIESGSQGAVRNDVVALRYSKNVGTGVETVALVVVKGDESASGKAYDPFLNNGSIVNGATTHEMALWRIPVEGVSMRRPEKMHKTFSNLMDVANRLDAVEGSHDLRWQTLWEGDWWAGKASDSTKAGSRTLTRSASGAKQLCFLFSLCEKTEGGTWVTRNTGWYSVVIPSMQWPWGAGHTFAYSYMRSDGGADWAYKYIYLYADRMVGYEMNDEGNNRICTLRGVYAIY